MKGIIYCRVSSQEQVSGTSLDNQKQACLEYAGKKGIKITEIFIEKGESATAANRTELIKALEYCREHKGEIGAFIVWKIDRFARNTTDHYGLQAQLVKYGTILHSVTEPIGDNPIGKMTEAVLAGYAQFENDIRKQRCEGGLQRKIMEGIWPWQPPIGYIHAKKISDRRKTRPDEPDPERFDLVQRGLKTYLQGGRSMQEVVKLMNQWGFRTRTGKPMFKQLFERILKDKYYAGILVDPWTGKEYRGLHQPMIATEEYEQIQYLKSHYSRIKNIPRLRLNPDFPLRRFVLCPCSRKLTGSWHTGRNKKYAYYECHNEGCQHKNQGIDAQELEKEFIKKLRKVTPTEGFLSAFRAVVIDNWQNQQGELKNAGEGYEKELRLLESKKERLMQMRINGELTKEEFLGTKESLENQIAGIRISNNETKTDELNIEASLDYAFQFLRDPARQWQDMDVEQKQRFQRLIFPSGIIFDKSTGKYGTAVLSPIFELNRGFTGDRSHLFAGAGIEPASGAYGAPRRKPSPALPRL